MANIPDNSNITTLFSTSSFTTKTAQELANEMENCRDEFINLRIDQAFRQAFWQKYDKIWNSIGRSLLSAFNWNTAKLASKINGEWAGTLPADFLGDYDPQEPHPFDFTRKYTQRLNAGEQCEVCLRVVDSLHSLNCRHFYCIHCWTEYLHEKITGTNSTQITCMDVDCQVRLGDFGLKHLMIRAKYKEVEARFQKLCLEDFIKKRYALHCECPNAECKLVNVLNQQKTVENGRKTAQAQDDGPQKKPPPSVPIHCQCGHSFCFACHQEWHYPMNCGMLAYWKRCEREWHEKFGTNGTTAENFASEHLKSVECKQCPSCKTPIYKSGGCDHITCKCSHEFCWLCLASWHGHRCNGPECQQQAAVINLQIAQQRRALEELVRSAEVEKVYLKYKSAHSDVEAGQKRWEEFRQNFRTTENDRLDQLKFVRISLLMKKLCLAHLLCANANILLFLDSLAYGCSMPPTFLHSGLEERANLLTNLLKTNVNLELDEQILREAVVGQIEPKCLELLDFCNKGWQQAAWKCPK